MHRTLALVDTGFDGECAAPSDLVDSVAAVPDDALTWEVADGRTVEAPCYLGTVEIIGLQPMPAAITLLGHEFILGRGILDRYRVIFDHGSSVTVEL